MAGEADNRGAFAIQEYYCRQMDAPRYAVICAAVARNLTRDTEVGRRLLDWPGEPTKDALPLRFIGRAACAGAGGEGRGAGAAVCERRAGGRGDGGAGARARRA